MSDFLKNIKGGKKDNSKFYKEFVGTDIRDSIVVIEELRLFIPPLKEGELNQLEANILKEGVREPLIFWDKGTDKVLIDGHNRYGIIQKHGIKEFKTELRKFDSIEHVKDWMINLQLGRRNLTKEQTSYLRGMQYNREKKSTQETLKKGNSPLVQNEQTGETADRLSEQHKVSKMTIRRDADYARGIEMIGESKPVLKQEILSGVSKMKKSDIQAVGSGKKKVKELFEAQSPPPLSPSEGGQDMSKDKIDYHKDKITYHVKRLRAMGFSDKGIIDILKGLTK